ncbi:MAG: hypothetical protein ACI4P3_05450, partial [Candidatus Spyradosoma sp.]
TVELQEIKKPSARGTESINADNGKTQGTPPTTDGKEKVAQEAEKVNAYLESRRKYSLPGYEAEQSGLARKYSIDAGTASLVGLHEISEEKLRKAIALGGLANPSLGVVDLNARAGTGFGEITLIAPRTLIDKRTGRNAGTYAGDAWTPTVPQVNLIGDRKVFERARAYVKTVAENPQIASAIANDLMHELLNGEYGNDFFAYVFLRERGIDVPELGAKTVYPKGTVERVAEILGSRTFDVLEVKTDAQRRALTELYFELEPGAAAPDVARAYLREDGTLRDYALRRMLLDVYDDSRAVEGTDVKRTLMNVLAILRERGLGREYDAWKREKLLGFGAKEKIYLGRTDAGNKRWADATLGNISKAMNGEERRGVDSVMGMKKLVVAAMPQFSKLEQIRKNKELLDGSDPNEILDKAGELYFEVFGALESLAEEHESSFASDSAESALVDAFGTDDPGTALDYVEYDGIYDVPEEIKAKANELFGLLQRVPVKYFETKFRRPVGLGEFRAAVVPAGTDAAVVSALKEAGVSVTEYSADDAEDRAAKVRGVAAKASDVRFSLAMEESADAD